MSLKPPTNNLLRDIPISIEESAERGRPIRIEGTRADNGRRHIVIVAGGEEAIAWLEARLQHNPDEGRSKA